MPVISTAERRSFIMRVLRNQGHASVSVLSQALDVSEVTVRKDLRFLEERKLLLRTHGGAVGLDQYVRDLPLEEKTTRFLKEKQKIGLAAARLVEDGDTLIIDSGSTTLQVARHLGKKSDLIVASASLHIALELLQNPGIELMMLGGTVRISAGSVVGSYAEQMLRDHTFHKLFLAGDGFDAQYGLTTTDTREAHLNRMMMRSARQTIAVIDSSKIGRRGHCRICGAEDIETVVIDDGVSDKSVQEMNDAGIRVVIADGSMLLPGNGKTDIDA